MPLAKRASSPCLHHRRSRDAFVKHAPRTGLKRPAAIESTRSASTVKTHTPGPNRPSCAVDRPGRRSPRMPAHAPGATARARPGSNEAMRSRPSRREPKRLRASLGARVSWSDIPVENGPPSVAVSLAANRRGSGLENHIKKILKVRVLNVRSALGRVLRI